MISQNTLPTFDSQRLFESSNNLQKYIANKYIIHRNNLQFAIKPKCSMSIKKCKFIGKCKLDKNAFKCNRYHCYRVFIYNYNYYNNRKNLTR